jgi:hypothetical protein
MPTISDAKAIAATFALQQALPAALSGDVPNLANGLIAYSDSTGGSYEEGGEAQEAADQQPDL